MAWLHTLLVLVQVLSALGVIVLVLLQHGKGADMGAAFGSGASGSLFGATGSANFLSRTTGILAAVFFVSTLGISFVSDKRPQAPASVMEGAAKTAPAAPAAGDVPAAVGAQPAPAQDSVGGAAKSAPPSDIPK